jgi:type II restriction enzyme
MARRPSRKIEQAQEILKRLGLPPAQQNEISALTLLSLCGLSPNEPWRNAKSESQTISKGIMAFIEGHYGKKYAPNTRETVRRQVLHQFVQAGIVVYNPDDPSLPTNSPRAHYALTPEALSVIQTYRTRDWKAACKRFLADKGSLLERYLKKRSGGLVPVQLPSGQTLDLSPGKHNVVQAAVVEQFIPRFAPGSRLLYLGDAAKKTLYLDTEGLMEQGISMNEHDKLPDIVFFNMEKNRLFLVEAVTSHGPMSPKRFTELQEMLSECKATKIYVSAFPDLAEFRRHMKKIAWETEVWITEVPDHMIHYDGEKFLGAALS